MGKKLTQNLTPSDVKKMPLAEFEDRFGFRPTDALEKYWFASNAERLTPLYRDALLAGVCGPFSLDDVVMD